MLRTATCGLVVACTLLAGMTGQAAPTVSSIRELKSLESKLHAVVEKVLPATVSLFSTKNGASGSGVIVSEEGLILTAGHVVRGVEEMTVIFPNGKQASGKVLGANYTRDIAMLQLLGPKPARGWPHADPGESKGLSPGDLVIALGHAGGYDPVRTPPVRFGRVMATGPDQFFTTDCALIGGDSGGPLFDLDGRVVGIHSSIGESLAANNHAGIQGFHQDWDKLLRGDSWGHLGDNSLLDNPDAPVIGIVTGNAARGGISVQHVFEGGPAGKAGLKAGDIIHGINGRPVSNLRRLHVTLSQFAPGEIIQIRALRGSQSVVCKVKLGRRGDILPDHKP